jgi:L-seryl-tRNA(Ser) seleniumtransferase
MSKSMNRRKFLGRTGEALVAGGAVAWGASSGKALAKTHPAETGEDYYSKLGVVPFINAAGTFTNMGGSIMPPSVQAAMSRAAHHFVNIEELHRASGEYLARRLQCEGALVTAGAASALTLATAACVTRGNAQAILNIPTDMTGLKNEVILQKLHNNGYNHAIRNCGVRMVEVETAEQYAAAFNERTAMTTFLNAEARGQISREDWVRVAHQHGVPCLIDAAADVPPISNLWNYTHMGFDLVAFSGGKGMRGPQCAGLLLGKKDLIEAARKNDFPYGETVGRGMKVGKEEIIGMVAAVDWFVSQDEQAMIAEFQKRVERIADHLKGISTLQTQIFVPPVANHVPHLLITYDLKQIKITGKGVQEKLRQGDPRIELNPSTGGGPAMEGLPSGDNTIVVGVWMLQPDEDMIVARRLREVLRDAAQG